MSYLLRGFCVWLLIIFAESIHGTLRELLLRPRVGDFRARQIAFFTGMALILAIATATFRWLRINTKRQLWHVGLMWAVLTLAFEIGLGVFVLGYSPERILEDYNLARGGLMGLGMIWLICVPALASRLRGKAY